MKSKISILCAILLVSCATTHKRIAQKPKTTPAPAVWPLPLDGCPAYNIVVNKTVVPTRFSQTDPIDMMTLKSAIKNCAPQSGGRSECLETLIKWEPLHYHAVCGSKK